MPNSHSLGRKPKVNFDGSVATLKEQAQKGSVGSASPRNLEQSCDEIETALNLTDPYSSCLPLSNRVHRFVSLDRPPGSPKGSKALARPHSPLDRSMVLFHDVIQVLHRSQLASPP